MIPCTFPNGSTTAAVTNPWSPRGVTGWYSLAPHRQQPLEGRRDVVDVPVRDDPARLGGRALRREAAVDQAPLVLVVADAELGVGQAPVWSGTLEVRLDAEQLGVAARGRLQVV